jgi:ubiquinone/menaquinone biosynthesis C-methylase UbiE
MKWMISFIGYIAHRLVQQAWLPFPHHTLREGGLILGVCLELTTGGALATAAGSSNSPLASAAPAESPSPDSPPYAFRAPHNPDGIGKFYFDREIAQVMGHQAADWLERPQRVVEEQPDELIRLLSIHPGESVADVGAGTGYFTRRLAHWVGPGGRVFAVEIQPEMLALLTNGTARLGLTNVIACLGSVANPHLTRSSVDLALMVDVYHEFEFPFEMMQAICQALKPNGRVAFVEYRAEDPWIPIKPLHKMTVLQLKREMSPHPLRWVSTISTLPRQHLTVFQKISPSLVPH